MKYLEKMTIHFSPHTLSAADDFRAFIEKLIETEWVIINEDLDFLTIKET